MKTGMDPPILLGPIVDIYIYIESIDPIVCSLDLLLRLYHVMVAGCGAWQGLSSMTADQIADVEAGAPWGSLGAWGSP